MFDSAITLIDAAKKIIVIQAENPDGDSLGSALAIEELLGDRGKDVLLYCPVETPKYLRYISGWDRVITTFDTTADLAIIVDTSADILLSKVLETRGVRHYFDTHPILVFDHHTTEGTLSFTHTNVHEIAISTSEVLFHLVKHAQWEINPMAARHMLEAQLSDSLGLTVQTVTAESYRIAAELTDLGAKVSQIEEARREFMKKSPEILRYKGELINRIEYYLEGKLAIVHVPFEEIELYSDKYNPGALIGDELRLVENVELSCVIKTYPDGKLTARLRSNSPISETVAGYFGGGGHPYAAGFRIYEDYEATCRELLAATDKALKAHYEVT